MQPPVPTNPASTVAMRRRALFGTLATIAAAGCTTPQHGGASATADQASAEALLPAPEGTTTYPFTVVTPHGTATLKARPQRVAVVAGLQDLEALLSLGGYPVITDTIAWPWQKSVVGDRVIEQFDIWSDAGLPFERILAAKPDVILAASYSALDKDYAKLARIAPVVALPTTPVSETWKADWKDILRTIAVPLDLAARAEDVIAKTEKAVDAMAAAHPAWRGKSLSFVMNRGEAAGLTVTNVHGTPVEALATRLGFAPQPHAEQLAKTDGYVSLEKVELIDADLLLIAQHGGHGTVEQARAWLTSNKLFQQLRAVKNGKVVDVERDANGDLPIAWAFDYPNALATPWLLTRFGNLVTPVLG